MRVGSVLARFGVDVSIVEAADRLLPNEEPEASETLETSFSSEGIAVHTGEQARQVTSQDGSFVVKLAGGTELLSERLLVTTGRKVNLSGLGLESAGLDSSRPFLQVDDHMRAADAIWAMGDVTGVAMFTHIAIYQSTIIAADILRREIPSAQYHAVPRVTFTDPEIGAVGITEAEAIAAGRDVVVVVKQLPATFRGWMHGSSYGYIKLIFERESGVLVGATVAGPQAGEMLGMLNLAVHAHLGLEALRSMIYAFPTFFGGIGEALGASGRGVTTVIDPTYQGVKLLDQFEADLVAK